MNNDKKIRKRLAGVDALNVGGAPTISQATLCIYADNLEPEVVTATVKCAPTKARRKGERDTDRPKIRNAPVGQWFLEAPGELPFDDKIQFLLKSTCNEESVWRDLAESHQIELRATIYLASWTEGFQLSNITLAEIAARKWSFSLSMYSAEGEEILEAFLGRAGRETNTNEKSSAGMWWNYRYGVAVCFVNLNHPLIECQPGTDFLVQHIILQDRRVQCLLTAFRLNSPTIAQRHAGSATTTVVRTEQPNGRQTKLWTSCVTALAMA